MGNLLSQLITGNCEKSENCNEQSGTNRAFFFGKYFPFGNFLK